jgi:FkbM family methyltransferase
MSGWLRSLGLLRTSPGEKDRLSLDAALSRFRARDLPIGTVIDIGASDGRWSRKAREYFPDAHCLLVEAQSAHQPALDRLKRTSGNIDYVIAAASDRCGTVYFEPGDLFGGVASHTQGPAMVEVAAVTVDSLVRDRRLPPPYLLKLDTHGFEVPILEGAGESLKRTHLVVVETYNFRIEKESLLFHEMCGYMDGKGFRTIDLCEPMHRPKDGALWQIDLFFLPAAREEFTSNRYT